MKKCCDWIPFSLENIINDTSKHTYLYIYIYNTCNIAKAFIGRKNRANLKEQIEWEYKERTNNLSHNELRGKCLYYHWNPVKWENSFSVQKGSTMPILKDSSNFFTACVKENSHSYGMPSGLYTVAS